MTVSSKHIDILVGIQGWAVEYLGVLKDFEGNGCLMIQIRRKRGVYRCRCGREFGAYYDGRYREAMDLPFGPHKQVRLLFWTVRVECPECGLVTESLDFVAPRVSYTRRLAAAVALSCRELRSIKSIAEQYGLHRETVKRMDKEALEAELEPASETCPQLIGVDEFSLRKRHVYATAVTDLEQRTIPWVSRDRTRESLAGYYKALGSEKCERIEAVAMDMWPPYEQATREHCPNADIVYDPFHLIASYGRDVIDKVRSQEAKRASAEDKQVIKGSRYLLLKNAGNLDPIRGEQVRLRELLKANRKLNTVYVLKDDLKQLWAYRSVAWARKWFKGWYDRAIRSRIEPLKRFARKLKNHLDGILAHCRFPIHTSLLEGVNNKIKVIKRVAFGYRDFEYFFLKIRGAFMCPTHTEMS